MRILIADDDKVSLALLRARLEGWDYEVQTCANGSEALAALQQDGAPQLAILDWEMPETDGPEVCQAIRARAAEPYIYILLLTTRNEKADIVAGMDAGADDYLVKPFDAHELRVRLRAGRRILDLQSELINAREELRIQATRDQLTGVLNRGAILQVLHAELSRARREARPIGVVMADLDHFKGINDTFGHAAGDAVLREATERMRRSVRPYDKIGRYGGEEFLIVTPGCDLECAAILAERMRSLIAAEPVPTPDGIVSMTCSFGVASSWGRQELDVDGLIRTADEALYSAKHAGRNTVEKALYNASASR